MNEVISTFLDNEAFDAKDLAGALATPEGRELLLDLVAVRALVNPAEGVGLAPVQTKRPTRWIWASAAAALVALGAGYQLGRAMTSDLGAAPPEAAATILAPEPTAVIRFEPGVNWTESKTPKGGN